MKSQDSRFFDRDVKRKPLEYKSETLLLEAALTNLSTLVVERAYVKRAHTHTDEVASARPCVPNL
jgi:hypothetical protein